MRIAIDLDNLAAASWDLVGIVKLLARRKDRFPLEVKFSRLGQFQELPSDRAGTAVVRPLGGFATASLANALSWVKSGAGTNAVYTFDLNLDTEPMRDLFAGGTPTVQAVIEIVWQSVTTRETVVAIPLEIANVYLQGEEGTPEVMPDRKASQAEAEAGTDNTKWMTPLRTRQAVLPAITPETAADFREALEVLPALDQITPTNSSHFREHLGTGLSIVCFELWKPYINEYGNGAALVIVNSSTVPVFWDGSPVPLPDGCTTVEAGTMPSDSYQLPLPAKQTLTYIAPAIPSGAGVVPEDVITSVLQEFVANGLSGGIFEGSLLTEGGYIVCDPNLVDALKIRGWTVTLPHHPSNDDFAGVPNDGTRSRRVAFDIEYFRSDINGTPEAGGRYISAWHEGNVIFYPAIIDTQDPTIMPYPASPTPYLYLINGYGISVMSYAFNGGAASCFIIQTTVT